ncbi:MAG: hypothetical protein HY644_04120 [Acidobacteria bacterium]|nr:hypothetical protein [Acidobacteriota bacterium]
MIKLLRPEQHVCTEKDGQGKRCDGSLKEYYPFSDYFNEVDRARQKEIEREIGRRDKNIPLLRCQLCGQLYYHPLFKWK